MRIALMFGALVLSLVVPAFAESPSESVDQLVVDRSTNDPTVNDYVMRTREVIQRAWKTPIHMSQAGAIHKHLRVNYVISRNGNLEAVELIQSSDDKEFDESILEAIRKAAPFPSFPSKIRAQRMLIRAKFLVGDASRPSGEQPTAGLRTNTSQQFSQEPKSDAKEQWEKPAGSPGGETLSSEGTLLEQPPRKKFRWGM